MRGYISEVGVLCGPLSIEVLDLNPTFFTVQLEVACEHVDKGALVIVLRHSPVFDLFICLSLQSDMIAAQYAGEVVSCDFLPIEALAID